MILYRGIVDESVALKATYLLYAVAVYIPVTFSLFLITFQKKTLFVFKNIFFVINFLGIILLANLNKIILGVKVGAEKSEKIIVFSPVYVHFYNLFVFASFFFCFFLIYTWYKGTKNSNQKKQAIMIFLGGILTVIFSFITNVILPTLGDFHYNWFGQVSTIFLTTFTMYSINKYRLFDIKVVLTEVLIFFILIVSFVRIFIDIDKYNFQINTFFLLVWTLFGIFLVRSVRKEIEQREKAVVLVKKISEQNKKIESQKSTLEELLRIKEETLHIVNHQLNTPISIIKSAISMYKDKLWTEDKFIKVTNTEINRVVQTVSQFLSANKVEDGKFGLNKTKADFNTLVRTLIDEKTLLRKVRDTGIKMNFTEKENLPPIICDLEKMTEVVSNLLDNAINYSNKDIDVVVDVKENNIILKVHDHGIGIPKDSVSKLFERFSRLENAKMTRPDGSGLGLYVCKQIVEAHKGKIWVESDGINMGSTFFVSLPL